MRAIVFMAATALVLGCSTSTPDCGSPPDLAGSWDYKGTQSGPAALLTGTLTLSRTGTCTVAGTLSLTVDDGSGTPVTSGWTTAGDFLDDSIVELNAVQGGDERHHVGIVRADSIKGSWAVTGGGANGSFTLKRTGP
jgi:hypothetical protein